jgi:steroid 5-alpha reductase family enzyme
MIYTYALIAILAFALSGWLLSFATRHYSHVDSMWSLFIAITAYVTAIFSDELSLRGGLVLTAVTLWALRLSIFLTWRNWGKEDHRYETIRQNNEPHFWLKSIYIIFAFQGILAWLISYPIYSALSSHTPLQWLDYAGLALFLTGLYWEVLADWQLMQFRARPNHQNAVLNTGLWRYSRHPNYFGEALIWWGFALLAAADGHAFVWFSPVVMTFLLLKLSGVRLMEQTIHQRRPGYHEYVATTNAFIPGLPKRKQADDV